MIGLAIFIAIAVAGCIFLIYFLVAMWRELHPRRRGLRVQIIKGRSASRNRARIFRIYDAEKPHSSKKTGSGHPWD